MGTENKWKKRKGLRELAYELHIGRMSGNESAVILLEVPKHYILYIVLYIHHIIYFFEVGYKY